MIYYEFKNYEEFKELFGMVEHGNGVKSRKNKILLSLYKDKAVFKAYVKFREIRSIRELRGHFSDRYDRTRLGKNEKNKRAVENTFCAYDYRCDNIGYYDYKWDLLRYDSLPQLKSRLYLLLSTYGLRKDGATHMLSLMNMRMYSDLYETDSFCGLCEDGTLNAIRYVNVERGKVFKMKAGKMFNHILDCNVITSALPEPIKRWLSEEFVGEWVEHARENIGEKEYTLHVNDDFESIYDRGCCAGYDTDNNSFGSCMAGEEQWTFYRDAVDAKAAYLTDSDDMIVARCIIFTDVKDQDGNVYRLAERQYSKHKDPALQRQLIAALIRGGYIDGFKAFGASCGDSMKFVDCDGNSLENKRFRISCRLEDGDTLSYQDSFKWYDYDQGIADNYGCGDIDLATTESSVSIDNHAHDVWSEYNDEYIDEDCAYYVETRGDYFYDNQVVTAYVLRRYGYDTEMCFEDDCLRINGDYYYAGKDAESPSDYGIYECPQCGDYFVPGEGDSVYSDLTEEDYCCDECLKDAEKRWHEDNGEVFADWDEKWYDADEVIEAMMWIERWYDLSHYGKTTISIDEFNSLAEDGGATEYNGVYYIDRVMYDGSPAHVGRTEIAA